MITDVEIYDVVRSSLAVAIYDSFRKVVKSSYHALVQKRIFRLRHKRVWHRKVEVGLSTLAVFWFLFNPRTVK